MTSTSPAPTCCVVGPETRTSIAKSTASTAECGSGRQSASSSATTGNWSPLFVQGIRWVMVAWKISASTTEDKVYLVRFLDDPGPIKLLLPPARYTTSTGAVRGSWGLQIHIASAFPRGIQRNVDESRGAAVASWFSSRHRSSIVLQFVVTKFESLSLSCSWCSESLGLVSERFFPLFFCICPAEPPAQCWARVRVKRRNLRRRAVAFSSLFHFALPTTSSAQSRGATRAPCSRVTWYMGRYGPLCHSFFSCVAFVLFCFFGETLPPSRGCSCCHLPFRVFVVSSSNRPPCRWSTEGFSHDFSLVLAPVFPSISTRAHLVMVPFLWLVCRRVFPAPPAPPAVCGRF